MKANGKNYLTGNRNWMEEGKSLDINKKSRLLAAFLYLEISSYRFMCLISSIKVSKSTPSETKFKALSTT